MTRLILEFLLIFKISKATFRGIQIHLEGGSVRPLGHGGLSIKIWLTTINALRRQRQDRMERLSIESETIIKIYGMTAREARRAPRPMMTSHLSAVNH